MTSVSTLLAPVLTPLLTLWLVGERLPVDGRGMAVTILQIVLVPVVLGLLVRMVCHASCAGCCPPCCGCRSSSSALSWPSSCRCRLTSSSTQVSSSRQPSCFAVGVLLGYLFGRVTGQGEVSARTMAIEVGMQNSGLASGLAATFFTPVAALPGAVLSVWHNLSGALVAGVFRNRPPGDVDSLRSEGGVS